MVKDILNEPIDDGTVSPAPTPLDATSAPSQQGNECVVGEWSEWSGCSKTCGDVDSGVEFRWRIVKHTRTLDTDVDLDPCPTFVKKRSCTPSTRVLLSVNRYAQRRLGRAIQSQ